MLSFVAALALAAGPEFHPDKPPPMVPKEGASFWREVYRHGHEQAELMIKNHAKELGLKRSEYTAGDLKCMALFNAWASVEHARRANPRLCPESVSRWLEKAHNEACHDQDPPNTPGAATGRGLNTVRRAILGRLDVHREPPLVESLTWAAKAGAALPALSPSPAAPLILVDPERLPDVRPPALRKTRPEDVL